MKLYCIGEAGLCGLFSLAGAGYSVCDNADAACDIIASRYSKDEIIIISDTLLLQHDRTLDGFLNDPGKTVVALTSPSSSDDAAGTRVILRKLLGGL